MRKLVYLLALMLLVTGISTWVGAAEKTPNFRKAYWGQNRAEIKKQESGLKIAFEEKEYVAFIDTLDNKNCDVVYYFTKTNKLYRAAYFFNEEHSNDNAYVDDYLGLVELIEKKYGTAEDHYIDWKDSLYKDDDDHIGYAVAYGHAEMSYAWDLPTDTHIWLRLYGDNGDITTALIYYSKTLDYDWDDDKGKI